VEKLKKISILLVITLALSALVLPGLAFAKGKPTTPPGQIRLHAVGEKPSTPPGQAKKSGALASALNLIKKQQGKKKFALRGTVVGDPVTGDTSFTLKVKAGNLKRIKKARDAQVTIVVKTEDPKTVFKPKGKGIGDLDNGMWVNVKGKITGWKDGEPTLEARLVIMKLKPSATDD